MIISTSFRQVEEDDVTNELHSLENVLGTPKCVIKPQSVVHFPHFFSIDNLFVEPSFTAVANLLWFSTCPNISLMYYYYL